jgi:hypothetical protein
MIHPLTRADPPTVYWQKGDGLKTRLILTNSTVIRAPVAVRDILQRYVTACVRLVSGSLSSGARIIHLSYHTRAHWRSCVVLNSDTVDIVGNGNKQKKQHVDG